MTLSRVALAVIGLALLGSASTPTSARTENAVNDSAAIEATLEQYEAVLNASDVNGILDLYSEDGVFMPTEAPTAVGHDQVRAAYEHIFSLIKLNIAFSIEEIVQRGDLAFARTVSKGEVTVLAEEATLPEENRELFVLEKNHGDWKIARYMFNKTAPRLGQ